MRLAIYVTARNKSTRLPRKVMRKLQSRTLLELVIERAQLATKADLVVVCTSSNPADNEIAVLGDRCGANVFRGDEEDVLHRYLEASRRFGVGAFAVTWGDEVLCDPGYLDRTLAALVTNPAPDLVVTEGLPEGTYCYGVSVDALARVVAGKRRRETEVWRAYFDQPEYRTLVLRADAAHARSDLRLTCDYPEDLALLEEIYQRLYRGRNDFTLDQVIEVLNAEPHLKAINAHRRADYELRIRTQTARD